MANGILGQIAAGPSVKFDPLGSITQAQGAIGNLEKLRAFREEREQTGKEREAAAGFEKDPVSAIKKLTSVNPQLGRQAAAAFREIGAESMKDFFTDIGAANAMPDVESKRDMLETALRKLPPGSTFHKATQEVANESDNDLDDSVRKIFDLGANLGFIEAKTLDEIGQEGLKLGIEGSKALASLKNAEAKAQAQEFTEKVFERVQSNKELSTTIRSEESQIERKKLSNTLETQIADIDTKVNERRTDLAEMMQIAEDMTRHVIGGGLMASAKEFLKEKTGAEDYITTVRKRAQRLKITNAIQNLPPGVASDKDIELALKPFPADNAGSQPWIDYVDGIAKMAAINTRFSEEQSKYISKNGTNRGFLQFWDANSERIGTEEVNRINGIKAKREGVRGTGGKARFKLGLGGKLQL